MATKNTAVMQTAIKATLPHWQQATWEDYLACCDDPALERTMFLTYG